MAFLADDETGLPNSTSFITTLYADNYFLDRLNAGWASLTTAQKESNLIKATSYVDMVYGTQFVGSKLLSTQALSFPRVVDGVTIYPIALKNAVCELAFKASTAELMIDSDQRTIKESVGSITVEYDKSSSQLTQYNAVYNLLKPYLFGSQYSAKVVRV